VISVGSEEERGLRDESDGELVEWDWSWTN
jgi:hypothetical protein